MAKARVPPSSSSFWRLYDEYNSLEILRQVVAQSAEASVDRVAGPNEDGTPWPR
jgi:hypothetical protein